MSSSSNDKTIEIKNRLSVKGIAEDNRAKRIIVQMDVIRQSRTDITLFVVVDCPLATQT